MTKHNFQVLGGKYICSLCNKEQEYYRQWDEECGVTTFVRPDDDQAGISYEGLSDEEVRRKLGFFDVQEDDR